MKLSDAIALGQHLIKWTNGRTLYDGQGCACGMALAAHGEQLADVGDFYNRYPWAKEHGLWVQITHEFDRVLRGQLTLDQLIDWVRSIEPAEEEAPVAAIEQGRGVLVAK